MNQLVSNYDYNLRILTLLPMVLFFSTISAQDVDGLVLLYREANKDIGRMIRLTKIGPKTSIKRSACSICL